MTIAVSDVWKGGVTVITVIETARDSAICGFQFQIGQDYLVYAFEGDGRLQTNLCSRTQPLANARDDLAALGQGAPPQAGTERPASSAPWPIAVAFIVLAATALPFLILRRRRQRAA